MKTTGVITNVAKVTPQWPKSPPIHFFTFYTHRVKNNHLIEVEELRGARGLEINLVPPKLSLHNRL